MFIHFLQFFERGVSVNLRCRKTFVPQQLFHRLQVCMMVKHGSSKTMPQDMRTSFALRGYQRQVSLHQNLNFAWKNPITVPCINKESLLFFSFSLLFEKRCPQAEILSYCIAHFISIRYYTLLVSFSGHLNLHLIQIHICQIQSY